MSLLLGGYIDLTPIAVIKIHKLDVQTRNIFKGAFQSIRRLIRRIIDKLKLSIAF